MKLHVTLLPSLLLCMAAKAQITVTHNHLMTAGKQIISGRDQTEYKLPASGANKVWDFRSLDDSHRDTFRFGQASTAPGHSNFPDANLTQIYVQNPNNISFINVNDSSMVILGSYNIEDSTFDENPYVLAYVPMSYNAPHISNIEQSVDVYSIKTDPDGGGPLPYIDSLEVTMYASNLQVTNGWGTLKLPIGDFQVLKYMTSDFNKPVARILASSTWQTAPDTIYDIFSNKIGPIDTSFTVDFWTNDASIGFPLLTYYYDAGDTSSSEFYFLVSHAPYTGIKELHVNTSFVYPNPASQVLKVSAKSANSSIYIYDVKGQLVLVQDLNNNHDISVAHLARGVYTAKLVDNVTGVMTGLQKIILANP